MKKRLLFIQKPETWLVSVQRHRQEQYILSRSQCVKLTSDKTQNLNLRNPGKHSFFYSKKTAVWPKLNGCSPKYFITQEKECLRSTDNEKPCFNRPLKYSAISMNSSFLPNKPGRDSTNMPPDENSLVSHITHPTFMTHRNEKPVPTIMPMATINLC